MKRRPHLPGRIQHRSRQVDIISPRLPEGERHWRRTAQREVELSKQIVMARRPRSIEPTPSNACPPADHGVAEALDDITEVPIRRGVEHLSSPSALQASIQSPGIRKPDRGRCGSYRGHYRGTRRDRDATKHLLQSHLSPNHLQLRGQRAGSFPSLGQRPRVEAGDDSRLIEAIEKRLGTRREK